MGCAREANRGRLSERRRLFAEAMLRRWNETGSLYWHPPEELPSAWMSPLPIDVEEPTEYEPATEARQIWSQMYPIRSEGGWVCCDCGGIFTVGLGCVLCVEPVCRDCVRNEQHTRHYAAPTADMTLAEIGRLLDPERPISGERVRSIEMRALAKLRNLDRYERLGLSDP